MSTFCDGVVINRQWSLPEQQIRIVLVNPED
jgi:hypothetical protein